PVHGGAKSVAMGLNGNSSQVSRPLGASPQQWYADFWMWTNPVGGSTGSQWVGFGTNNMASIAVDQAGVGHAGLANSTVWIAFSTTTSAWHHYLFEVMTAVAGTARLTVDGVVV